MSCQRNSRTYRQMGKRWSGKFTNLKCHLDYVCLQFDGVEIVNVFQPVPNGGDFKFEMDGETARLIIETVYPEDEGMYTCIASNALGKAYTSSCLVVDGMDLYNKILK